MHGYDVWVHMEDAGETESSAIVRKACQSMAKHAAVSSNLAALSLHVTRMLRQLVRDIQRNRDNHAGSEPPSATLDFSTRISRVAKARATAGALQLFRLLCHPVVHNCAKSASGGRNTHSGLEEALLYHTRGDLPCDQPAGRPLVHSILDLITVTGGESNDALMTPEIYDATVISVQLLLVLCGTQLYQPFVSSFQSQAIETYENYILDELLRDDSGDETMAAKNYGLFDASTKSYMSNSNHRDNTSRRKHHVWTHLTILETLMEWFVRRPLAPEHSLAHYYSTMSQAAVVAQGGHTLGRDGMYESYQIVHATAPKSGSPVTTTETSPTASSGSSRRVHHRRESHNVIVDATKGVLVLGSTIIMLPFRLMTLLFGVIASNKNHGGEDVQFLAGKIKSWSSGRTKDVLWLSDSLLTDLTTSLVLLLLNNRRNGINLFRSELSRMIDKQWVHKNDRLHTLSDLPLLQSDFKDEDDSLSMENIFTNDADSDHSDSPKLTMNFEALFDAFGRTLHTEIGALLLYTMYQSCPSFAESLVVRSDLNVLILPLLRTLYFSSSPKTFVANDFVSKAITKDASSNAKLDIRSCPFRSPSQLYVIIIILLLFSQDSIFGRDAFRRITVTQVLWYKERNLRNINLGSLVLLTLLRLLMFNLQRLQDGFLLSNCCAILQNMSPPMIDLHEYAAMRLVSVTITIMKKHLSLYSSSAGESTTEHRNSTPQSEDYLSTPLGMYEEVALTLLGVINHCLSPKAIEGNLHLVYSLVYHQGDFNRIMNARKLYPSKLLEHIQSVTQEAAAMIQEEGARTASKALNVLVDRIDRLQQVAEQKRKKEHVDDISFTYEEEADPEIFFVPYVWETIVDVVTSTSIEWRKEDIRVFSLLDPVDESSTDQVGENTLAEPNNGVYGGDVGDIV